MTKIINNKRENLTDKEKRYLSIMANIPDIIWTTDINGHTSYISNNIKDILGFTNNEIYDHTPELFHERIHPDDLMKIKNALKDLFTKNIKYNIKYRILDKDNEWKWINDRSIQVYEKDGIKYADGILSDITKIKNTEESLLVSEEKLRENNKTLNKFFAIIAHDLKSPFQSMLGFSEILKEDYSNYNISEQKEFIEIINNGLNSTYKLLDNLLSWCHLQNGTINYNPKIVNLYTLENDTIELLKLQAKNKCISLLNRTNKNIQINADTDMLSTIIRNLISNAIKFTNKGGTITIYAQINGNNTQITIEDNGIGISKEKQSQIFSITENSSTKGTENESGSGLGLILCKEFAEKHNGKIWMESTINEGSKFSFTIAS
jgi:PAS domain S-box-containing protein